MHLTAAFDLFLAHDRNVVFRLASHNAGVAADARVEVDRHSPLVILIVNRLMLLVRVHRFRILVVLMALVRMRLVIFEIPDAKNIAAFHIEMDLGRSDFRCSVPLRYLTKAMIHRIRAANIKGTVTEPRADLARTRAAIAHEYRDHIIRLAGRYPHRDRSLDLTALIFQGHEI